MFNFEVTLSHKTRHTIMIEAEEVRVADGVLEFFNRLPDKNTVQGALVSTRIYAFKKWASYKLIQ